MQTTKNKNINIRKEEKYYYAKQKPVIYNKDNYYYYVLVEWKKYLIENGYSKDNIYQCKRQMIYFLDFLEKQEILNLKDISVNIINRYITNYQSYYRLQTVKNYNKHLRQILRFLFNNNYMNKDLSIFVPCIKTSKHSNIPSVWSNNSIQKIFENINLNNKSDKKLYLILLLSIRYGLRAIDIRNLKLENIDWKAKRITLIQSKTKNVISLPLLPEVYSALVDYIKNARPKTDERFIIVKNDGTPISHDNFYNNIARLLKKSDINISNKKRGIHSMRHTLASSLLKENIPLPIISTILGHSNTSSTTIYLKVDESKLIKCCLSLREVDFNNEL